MVFYEAFSPVLLSKMEDSQMEYWTEGDKNRGPRWTKTSIGDDVGNHKAMSLISLLNTLLLFNHRNRKTCVSVLVHHKSYSTASEPVVVQHHSTTCLFLHQTPPTPCQDKIIKMKCHS